MNHSLGARRKGAQGERKRTRSRKRAAGSRGGGGCSKGGGAPLIFLAYLQKREVGRGEPGGSRPVSSSEMGIGSGMESNPLLTYTPGLKESASSLSNEAPGLFTQAATTKNSQFS